MFPNSPSDDEARLAVDLAYFYREGGSLPHAGGLFDQDHRYIMLIKAGLRALDKKAKRDQDEEDTKARTQRR